MFDSTIICQGIALSVLASGGMGLFVYMIASMAFIFGMISFIKVAQLEKRMEKLEQPNEKSKEK